MIFKNCKNNRGDFHRKVWMFGGVQKNLGKCFAFILYDLPRDRQTLVQIPQKLCQTGIQIITDQWSAYYNVRTFDLSEVKGTNGTHLTFETFCQPYHQREHVMPFQ